LHLSVDDRPSISFNIWAQANLTNPDRRSGGGGTGGKHLFSDADTGAGIAEPSGVCSNSL